MLRSCPYCGRIHERNFDCGHRPKQKNKRREEEAGRYSWAFRKKSEEIKERSHFLCAVCFSEGRLNNQDLSTHHIIKLTERPDLLLEESNLICLCRYHHDLADAGKIDPGKLLDLARERDGAPG